MHIILCYVVSDGVTVYVVYIHILAINLLERCYVVSDGVAVY